MLLVAAVAQGQWSRCCSTGVHFAVHPFWCLSRKQLCLRALALCVSQLCTACSGLLEQSVAFQSPSGRCVGSYLTTPHRQPLLQQPAAVGPAVPEAFRGNLKSSCPTGRLRSMGTSSGVFKSTQSVVFLDVRLQQGALIPCFPGAEALGLLQDMLSTGGMVEWGTMDGWMCCSDAATIGQVLKPAWFGRKSLGKAEGLEALVGWVGMGRWQCFAVGRSDPAGSQPCVGAALNCSGYSLLDLGLL